MIKRVIPWLMLSALIKTSSEASASNTMNLTTSAPLGNSITTAFSSINASNLTAASFFDTTDYQKVLDLNSSDGSKTVAAHVPSVLPSAVERLKHELDLNSSHGIDAVAAHVPSVISSGLELLQERPHSVMNSINSADQSEVGPSIPLYGGVSSLFSSYTNISEKVLPLVLGGFVLYKFFPSLMNIQGHQSAIQRVKDVVKRVALAYTIYKFLTYCSQYFTKPQLIKGFVTILIFTYVLKNYLAHTLMSNIKASFERLVSDKRYIIGTSASFLTFMVAYHRKKIIRYMKYDEPFLGVF